MVSLAPYKALRIIAIFKKRLSFFFHPLTKKKGEGVNGP